MGPSATPNPKVNVEMFQVRTVFTDSHTLEQIGATVQARGLASGFVVRQATLSGGSGFELVICVPIDKKKRAERIADLCNTAIRKHWVAPATFIESTVAKVTANPEFADWGVSTEWRNARRWGGLGVAAATVLALAIGLRRGSSEVETEPTPPTGQSTIEYVGIADSHGRIIATLPDFRGTISNNPDFERQPNDMAAIESYREVGSTQRIAAAYRTMLEKAGQEK